MSMVMNKTHVLLVLVACLCVACTQKKAPELTPWGTPVEADGDSQDSSSAEAGKASGAGGVCLLPEIIDNGEIIVLTVSGPDTYYDYRGHGLGVQYMMAEQFASKLGISARVELCKDTMEMVRKLNKGIGDVIAVQLHKDGMSPNAQTGKSSYYKYGDLRFCGANDKKRGTSWAVNKENVALADSLDRWFTSDLPAKTLAREDYLLSLRLTHSARYIAHASSYTPKMSTYNHLFQRYAGAAGLDWRLLAAQCYQESGYDPGARSWAGACGLMQIMPTTADRLGLARSDMFDAEKNVAAGARLMGILMREFSDIPNTSERINFALAAYNAGSGHVRDAMALARKHGANPHSWASVAQFILKLREPEYYQDPVVRHGFVRGTETYNYVQSIRRRYGGG